MQTTTSSDPTPHLVDPERLATLNLIDATAQFLTPHEGDDREPCLLRGTVPPGGIVPIHRHADPETFVVNSGRLEALRETGDGPEWIAVGPGQIFHIPGNAKHAWRNPLAEPAVALIFTTVKIGRFFTEVATPAAGADATADRPSEQAIARLLEISERYEYWNASPEENAAAGLKLG